jgi:DNA-binding XRE family transcriptional regulator
MGNTKKMHKESWRDVFGYDGVYQVSNLGRVRNKHKKILTHWVSEDGYHSVTLVDKDSGRKNWRVHRLVGLCFVPIYSLERDQINHIDGNKWNNVAENLEWCNNSENQLHRYRVLKTGALYGVMNNRAKLTEQQTKEVKAKYQTGEYTQKQLAEEYNVTQSTISQIVTNKIRKYE